MDKTSEIILRLWVLTTGLAGISAATGAYLRPRSPYNTLYRSTKSADAAVFARMYATWLLTSTTIRVAFFFTPDITPAGPLFWLAFGTYCIALWHFALEIFVFRTAPLRPGGLAPLCVAGGSIAWFSFIALASPSI